MTSHLHMARTATRKVYSQSDSTGNSVDLTPYTQTDPPGVSTGTGAESDIYDCVVLLCPRRMRGALSDTANRPSVCPSPRRAPARGYRHACCLQLNHVRTADPSADGRRSAASQTAVGGGGHISCRRPGSDNLFYMYDHSMKMVGPEKQQNVARDSALHHLIKISVET